MRQLVTQGALSLAFAAATLCGCSDSINSGQGSGVSKDPFQNGLTPGARDQDKVPVDPAVDYGSALRTTALKLVANYPTLSEIKDLQFASDQEKAFETRIDAYLADPRFAFTQRAFWSDTFRMGGQKTVGAVSVNLDAAPTFAAMLVAKDQPITNLFTASQGTCLQLLGDGSFAAGSCPNLSSPVVGLLSDSGVHAQFFSSMAFRRVRWIQETFQCQKFPAESGTRREDHPGGPYTSPWDFSSVAGGKAARINFQSDDSLICANCHSTINHIAPILGHFDEAGARQQGFAVLTPVPGSPVTQLIDWLPPGQGFAWRYGQPVADLPALGKAIAADPNTARCIATRVWNWAMSRGDVVVDQATLTQDLIDELSSALVASNYNVKKLIRKILTNPSYVRY